VFHSVGAVCDCGIITIAQLSVCIEALQYLTSCDSFNFIWYIHCWWLLSLLCFSVLLCSVSANMPVFNPMYFAEDAMHGSSTNVLLNICRMFIDGSASAGFYNQISQMWPLFISHLKQIDFRPFSHWKLISKFMLIGSFRKKISCVNSQLCKERNFKILFCNLEHVLFCGRNFTYGALWLVSRPVLTNIKWSVDDVDFWKFISNVKVLTFEKKILSWSRIVKGALEKLYHLSFQWGAWNGLKKAFQFLCMHWYCQY